MRARWRKPAGAGAHRQDRQRRRERPLIQPNQEHREGRRHRGHKPERARQARRGMGGGFVRRVGLERIHDCGAGPTLIRVHASANLCSSSVVEHVVAAARAMSRRSERGGTSAWCRRNNSRSRRLARLRCTAPPTALVEAITQTRDAGDCASAGRAFHHTVNARQSIRRPVSRTARISIGRRKCCSDRKRMSVSEVRANVKCQRLTRSSLTNTSAIRRRSAACGLWRGAP